MALCRYSNLEVEAKGVEEYVRTEDFKLMVLNSSSNSFLPCMDSECQQSYNRSSYPKLDLSLAR